MLINKLLLEYRYVFIRSIDPKILRYMIDLDMRPIVKWTNEDIYKYAFLRYNDASVLRMRQIAPYIRPLNTIEIKELLFDFEEKLRIYWGSYVCKLSIIDTLLNCLVRELPINRNNLLC